ncbi:MAG: hypothetical protein DLM61_14670 [Pseudonocardiales bacterium]|nr:MAG: hypothetical protein DLM61_14670 [Pseudonocardiales bacterium]
MAHLHHPLDGQLDLRPTCPYITRTRSEEVAIPSSKTERIEVRVSEREQEVLRQAAEAEDMTVSAFILSTVVPRAREVVHRNRDITMSARAYEQFLAELDRPAENVPALLELFSRSYRIQFGES